MTKGKIARLLCATFAVTIPMFGIASRNNSDYGLTPGVVAQGPFQSGAITEEIVLPSSDLPGWFYDFGIHNLQNFSLTITGIPGFDPAGDRTFGALRCGQIPDPANPGGFIADNLTMCGPLPDSTVTVSATPTKVTFNVPGSGNGLVFFVAASSETQPELVIPTVGTLATPEPATASLVGATVALLALCVPTRRPKRG